MTPRAPKRRATVTVVLTEEELSHLILNMQAIVARGCKTCGGIADVLRRARVAKPRRKT